MLQLCPPHPPQPPTLLPHLHVDLQYCRFDPTCPVVAGSGGTPSVLAYPPTMPIIAAGPPPGTPKSPPGDAKPPAVLPPPSRPSPSPPAAIRNDGANTPPLAAPSPLPPPSPLAVDPCAGSSDSCCRRAGSYSACELDSPAADGCTYFGSCQPAEPSPCYSQARRLRAPVARGDMPL